MRDWQQTLLISHDPPSTLGLTLDDTLALLVQHNRELPLAINIKSDGLQSLLLETLARHGVKNYFLFDMSVPDAVQSLKAGLRIYTRHSDVEPSPTLYGQAAGVWMDALFDDIWLSPAAISAHLAAGKEVCLVSPELHSRPHLSLWERLQGIPDLEDSRLLLCTDLPEEAARFFTP